MMLKTQEPGGAKAVRADVNRNRHKILEVARQIFAERAVDDVSLDEIAVAAGLGRTTLFRHIGSKNELIHEIYRERVSQVRHLTSVALSYEDPFDGLAFMLGNLAEWLNEDRNLFDYSQRIHDPVESLATTRAIEATFVPVLDRAWQAHTLSVQLQPGDIMPLISFALRDPPAQEDSRRQIYLDLILRGLRA